MTLAVEQLDSAWVTAGVVLRAHGVRGELRAALDLSIEEFSESLKQVRFVRRNGDAQVFTLQSLRVVHAGVLIALEGLTNREVAQGWAGAQFQVPASAVPTPEPGETYVYELPGATVRDVSGQVVGVVKRVMDNAGQPLLALDSEAGERLLPLVPAFHRGFDRESRVLTVDIPEGLWE